MRNIVVLLILVIRPTAFALCSFWLIVKLFAIIL